MENKIWKTFNTYTGSERYFNTEECGQSFIDDSDMPDEWLGPEEVDDKGELESLKEDNNENYCDFCRQPLFKTK